MCLMIIITTLYKTKNANKSTELFMFCFVYIGFIKQWSN